MFVKILTTDVNFTHQQLKFNVFKKLVFNNLTSYISGVPNNFLNIGISRTVRNTRSVKLGQIVASKDYFTDAFAKKIKKFTDNVPIFAHNF